MTLKEQVKEFVKFDEGDHQIKMESYPLSYRKEHAHGRLDENHRLASLNNLWPEVVECLQESSCDCEESLPVNDISRNTICYRCQTLAKIKEAVKGTK